LEKELQKLGNQINNEHRRADDRVYSVLTREQRRYWTR
jgi:Spy/CpxP family protein refolding chaperone